MSSALRASSSVISTMIRYGVFTVLIFAKILLIWWLAKHHGQRLFSENSVLEWIQFANLLLAAAFTGFAAWRTPAFRELLTLLALLPLVAAIREQDAAFDRFSAFLGWQAPFILVAFAGLIYGLKGRNNVVAQVSSVLQHRSVGVLWAGFILAIPFAQMVGHKPFITNLFGSELRKPITRTIEESSESIGYLIIFFGLIDLCAYCKRKSRNSTPKA